MSVASEFADVPVIVPEGRAVRVPQGSGDGEPVGANSRIADCSAEALPVGVSDLRSGADKRSAEES